MCSTNAVEHYRSGEILSYDSFVLIKDMNTLQEMKPLLVIQIEERLMTQPNINHTLAILLEKIGQMLLHTLFILNTGQKLNLGQWAQSGKLMWRSLWDSSHKLHTEES